MSQALAFRLHYSNSIHIYRHGILIGKLIAWTGTYSFYPEKHVGLSEQHLLEINQKVSSLNEESKNLYLYRS